MPRYFFHLRGPQVGQYFSDSNGHSLADIASAKVAARRTAEVLLAAEMREDWRGWNFDIVDEHGLLELIFPIVQRGVDPDGIVLPWRTKHHPKSDQISGLNTGSREGLRCG